jgi:hypothetical protein
MHGAVDRGEGLDHDEHPSLTVTSHGQRDCAQVLGRRAATCVENDLVPVCHALHLLWPKNGRFG